MIATEFAPVLGNSGTFSKFTVKEGEPLVIDALIDGQYQPDKTYSGLYSAYCAWDAEWFTLSRHADYKAWLSAVLHSSAATPQRVAAHSISISRAAAPAVRMANSPV